ncbi:MAG: hypothetical protein JXQ26_09680 [Tissierellales bacterium]|nr:hypothetical protein [Tissierellales bacterium]MBN2828251.1 hypothetical protein [Tissierellales bacterium]
MRKKSKALIVLTVLMLVLTACSSPAQPTTVPSSNETTSSNSALTDYFLTLTGVASEDQMISAEEIMTLENKTVHMTAITSSGETIEGDVTGVGLDTILSKYGTSQSDYESIRIFAQDGYSIMVPKEIIGVKEILISYAFNGEPLDQKHQPLRAAIAEERSMYWVGQLAGFEFIKDSSVNGTEPEIEAVLPSKLVFMDAAFKSLTASDYPYKESIDQAVSAGDFLDQFGGEKPSADLFFYAVDDFTKSEKTDIFKTGFLKFTGENAPMFTGEELPQGMSVKNILWLQYSNTVFFSNESAFNKFENDLVTILDYESVPLLKVEEIIGLPEGEQYLLTATDGYTKEIDRETFLKGAIYLSDSGEYGINFEGMEKKAIVKNILSIDIITSK